MDEEIRSTISRLGTEAGMRMEDASVAALTLSQLSDGELTAVLDRLVTASVETAAIRQAARALAE